MKAILSFMLIMVTMMLGSCSAVEAIFKAGMWWAFFLVFAVIFIIGWLVLRRKK